MKKILLTIALVAGSLFSAQAQTECTDGRDNTHEDRVEYIRFTDSNNEQFVLLRSEGDSTLDLSSVTITHQWTYVKNGNDLEVWLPAIPSAPAVVLEDFVGIGAFAVPLNTLTKVNFDTFETTGSTVSEDGSTFTF